MALQANQTNRNVPGNSFETKTVLGCDNAYPTGGYAVTPQQLGFGSHVRRILEVAPVNFASAAVVPVLTEVLTGNVITGLVLQLQNFSTGAELANGTNASAYSYNVVAEGV